MKKTNYSYIGIAFTILIFGIIFIPRIVDRISKGDISRQESRSDQPKAVAEKKSDLVFIQNNGVNRKVPDFSFTNQNGKTITNKDFEGKVYVIEFFFTTCPTICPRMNSNLVQIQNEFEGFEDFGVASFTINPEHDTPEVLKTYAEKYGITNPNWHLLTGSKEAIYELANKGFYIYTAENPDVQGGFEHSGNFALIDKNGFVRSREMQGNPIIYYNGITSESEKTDEDGKLEEISALKEDIKKLLNE
ncbi:SCO family protein [Algibacter amylolyticus]|uniref:SCO family protein n=1 Tax=Algibacter amylolyticus TaxID=1608400 RepID=A0A5M7BG27_9FLAO|nr:SCO family protein [Algibacter amylolyticus]KAA5827800.1 SCO family protein [Algibacter amylolyticus]MBB5267028.1 protein SCO1/2 [Algibacter amylolyticus]TSJ82045.1 SCO family protein [Algibacter amylolyticus]